MMTWPFATRQDLNLKRMISRMSKAARLDSDTFRELRDDASTTVQSVSLVAIIGLCYGAGLGFFGFFVAGVSVLDIFTIILIGLRSAVILAFVSPLTTFLIVTRLSRRTTDFLGRRRPVFVS